MKKKLTIFLLITLPIATCLKAQRGQNSSKFWKLYSYYGEVRLNGFYRDQTRTGGQIKEKQQSTMYSGGILLHTKNYIWTPKFIVLDLDGEFTPDKANEKYLVIPDQAETRDMRKFDARMTFLPQNKFSIGSYFNYGRVYNNRENLSNMRSTGTNWGSTLYYRIKKFPFSIGYTSYNQNENEIQTGRKFLNRQNILEGKINTSSGKTDRHELVVSYNDFFRKDFSKSEVSIQSKNISYNGFVFFGSRQQNTFNTFLSGVWQKGNEIFTRYQAIENINMELRNNFKLGTSYMLFSDNRPVQSVLQHKAGLNIQHQLFRSLHSQISYEYNKMDQSQYEATLQNSFADITYTKKILRKHDLDISYRYGFQTQKWNSQDGLINIFNEQIRLKDGSITLLSRPYVNIASIRVKDITGSIIYQENLDYRLFPQNDFVQIQRIPGSLIPDNTEVFLDYSAIQPGSYQYNSTNSDFSAGLAFFNRRFSIYYRKSVQDYGHLIKTDFITLNYYKQQVLGARVDYKYLAAGVEYDDMNSTVLPYQLYRYYINIQGTLQKKIILAVNGNMYDYKKLNMLRNVQYIDVYGLATYYIRPRISLSASLNYRKQKGEGVGLDLLSFRTEFNAVLHKLRFSVIYNYYNRVIYNETLLFNSVNVQVIRKF